MSSGLEKEPEHVEANRGSEPSDNPLARGLNITVSIPETVEIRTVNASVLADYEVWVFISSILSNAVVGFAVAYFQSLSTPNSTSVTWLMVALVFLVLLIIAIRMTLSKRESL